MVIPNILMTIGLAMMAFLVATSFFGNSSFIIASIGYGLWFSNVDAPLIFYVMALGFFLLLLVMMIGVIKRLSCNYAMLRLAALALAIACLVVSLYQNLAITAGECSIIILSDISMGISYIGMALFIGSYGGAISKNKETKNAKDE